MQPDWIIPDWPAPANVHAFMTTRAGGVSLPPFASFNPANHVGDDPAAVTQNRRRLALALDRPAQIDHGPDAIPRQLLQISPAHSRMVGRAIEPAGPDLSSIERGIAAEVPEIIDGVEGMQADWGHGPP
jgi:hypothetical protein